VAIKIMALVDPNGQVVNKIIINDTKPFTLPQGYSMHEWTDADEVAFQQYLASLKATNK